jgi:hypothetical protein
MSDIVTVDDKGNYYSKFSAVIDVREDTEIIVDTVKDQTVLTIRNPDAEVHLNLTIHEKNAEIADALWKVTTKLIGIEYRNPEDFWKEKP